MSAAFLSSASSTIRRARSSGGRSVGGCRVRRGAGRPSALGAAPRRRCSRAGVRSRSMRSSVVQASGAGRTVQRMVADIGRDRIRDEVAQRAAGRGPARTSEARQPQARAVEETTAVRAPGKCAARNVGPASRKPSRGATASVRQLEDPLRLVPRRQAGERLGRQDQRQVGRCRRRSTAQASSVSTVYDGPSRSSSIGLSREGRVVGDRQPRPSRAGRSAGDHDAGPACAAAGRPG